MSKKKGSIVAVALVLVAGAGGFFGGSAYQKTQTASTQANFSAGGGPGAMRTGQTGNAQGQSMMPTTGKILSSDSKSLTIKLADGSSKIVLLQSSLTVNKFSTGNVADLKTGEQVMVRGTSNSDGSLIASSIQLGSLPNMPGQDSNIANGSTQNSAGGTSGTGTGNSNNMGNAGAPAGMGAPGAMGGPDGMGAPGAPPSN